LAIREAPLGLIHLVRAHAEVEQDTRQLAVGDPFFTHYVDEAVEPPFAHYRSISEGVKPRSGGGYRLWVAVDSYDREISIRVEDGRCVAATTHGRVDHRSRRGVRHGSNNLFEHYWFVFEVSDHLQPLDR
jgi:hypothetical protein